MQTSLPLGSTMANAHYKEGNIKGGTGLPVLNDVARRSQGTGVGGCHQHGSANEIPQGGRDQIPPNKLPCNGVHSEAPDQGLGLLQATAATFRCSLVC